jgi:hypothetical protein
MKYLFICGAPRSGTTAMWRYLTGDERIVLGVERYGTLFFNQNLTKELFEKERFMNLQDGDTFYKSLGDFTKYYVGLEDEFNSSEVVGDKIPMLYRYLDGLFKEIPEAKVLIMLRNIIDLACSYESRASNQDDLTWSSAKKTSDAIDDWRESLKAIKKWEKDERVKVIVYEDFFHGKFDLTGVYKFIGIPLTHDAKERYENIRVQAENLEVTRERKLDLDAVQKLCEIAPFGLYREVLKDLRNLT